MDLVDIDQVLDNLEAELKGMCERKDALGACVCVCVYLLCITVSCITKYNCFPLPSSQRTSS